MFRPGVCKVVSDLGALDASPPVGETGEDTCDAFVRMRPRIEHQRRVDGIADEVVFELSEA